LLTLKTKFDTNTPFLQQYRRYATEQSGGGSSNAILYGGIATLVAGGGYYYFNQGQVKSAAKEAESKVKEAVGQGSAPAAKAFTGGDQGFISLKLDSVENINHNTKKFRFNLPEGDQVSGLAVASALITKYKGPDMEKPAIRPYTPVNDEGTEVAVPSLERLLISCRREGIPRPPREEIPQWSNVRAYAQHGTRSEA